MKDLENKSNNELLFEIEQLKQDHEALKLKMLNDYDKMEELEARFAKANDIIRKRLNKE